VWRTGKLPFRDLLGTHSPLIGEQVDFCGVGGFAVNLYRNVLIGREY
jgi:hypothetical protein